MVRVSKNSIIWVGAVLVLAVLAVTILPAFIRARNTPASKACISNLQQIDGATQQWALDNQKTTNDLPTWADLRAYLGRGQEFLSCPQGGKYTLGRLDKPPACSFPGHGIPYYEKR